RVVLHAPPRRAARLDPQGLRGGPRDAFDGRVLEDEAGAPMLDGIDQAACGAHDRQGPVAHGDHLAEAAWLEATGDGEGVAAGVDEACEALVEADLDASQAGEVSRQRSRAGLRGRVA